MIALRTCICVALVSGAFGGFGGPYGYGVAAPYTVHAAPVAAVHAVPTYSKVYTTAHVVAPAVTTATHHAAVTHVTKGHSYRTQHPVATPVARYSTYSAPTVHAVHTVPAVTKVAHVPAYGYGLGHGYGVGYGYGLAPYGVDYSYGHGYSAVLKH